MRIVFCMSDYVLHNRILSDYLAARPGDSVAVIKVPLVLKGKGRVETARRMVPRLSRRFLLGKLLEFCVLLAVTLVPKILRRGAVFRRLRRIARLHGLPFWKTQNIMSEETLAFLRAQDPDVVVTMVHQILKRPLIEIPRHGVVNLHPGVLPDFRGIQPYFWELSEGSLRGGATLHLIEDETIDTGGVLAHASYATWPGMSVQLNYYLTSQVTAQVLPACLESLVQGRLQPRPQDPDAGAYYRWPDSAAYDRLEARGHRLLKWRDLLGILCGKYDDFRADEELLRRAG
ncbi:MAG: formyltransferase family protein [Planctomycetota bacterium]|jgi:methionyl-tRNA formyltransferase